MHGSHLAMRRLVCLGRQRLFELFIAAVRLVALPL